MVRNAAFAMPEASAAGADLASSHSSPPIATAAAIIRGSRRRAAASIENPDAATPRRIKASAVLQAPHAMLAAMPDGPAIWPRMTANTIATANPFSVASSGVSVSWRAKNAGESALTTFRVPLLRVLVMVQVMASLESTSTWAEVVPPEPTIWLAASRQTGPRWRPAIPGARAAGGSPGSAVPRTIPRPGVRPAPGAAPAG